MFLGHRSRTLRPSSSLPMQWSLVLLFYLYILEGVPYGLQSRFLPLILRSSGLSLTALGFYKLLYIPWLLKSFYAPLVDTYLNKRKWLLISLTGLLSVTLTFSINHHILLPQSSKPSALWTLSACLFCYNFFAALQDIAVDGLALCLLTADQLALGNTIQVVGYKVGAILGGGLLTSLASVFSVHQLFAAIASIYIVGIFISLVSEELDERKSALLNGCKTIDISDGVTDEHVRLKKTHSADKFDTATRPQPTYKDALWAAVTQRTGTCNLIGLLLVYKLGEQGTMNMLPLMLLDRGASLGKIGFWTGVVGQITSIAGSSAGYHFQRAGRPSVDTLQLLMGVRFLFQVPLLYMSTQSVVSNYSFAMGVLCMNLTLFVSGAITTVMFTLMMQCTRSESTSQTQATHYTILSTAELTGKLVFGVLAAPFTDQMGYGIANVVFLVLSLLPLWFVRARRGYLMFPNPR